MPVLARDADPEDRGLAQAAVGAGTVLVPLRGVNGALPTTKTGTRLSAPGVNGELETPGSFGGCISFGFWAAATGNDFVPLLGDPPSGRRRCTLAGRSCAKSDSGPVFSPTGIGRESFDEVVPDAVESTAER